MLRLKRWKHDSLRRLVRPTEFGVRMVKLY